MSQSEYAPSLFQRVALPMVVALLATACASPQVIAPPSEEELNRVSQAVLEDAVYTNTLLRECSGVSPEAKHYAMDLAEVWQSLHGEALAGADRQYREHLRAEVIEYLNEPLALSAIHFSHQTQARATEELRLHTRSDNNQRIVCERRLKELEQNMDARPYVTSERDRLALAQLKGEAESRLPLPQAPTLAGGIPLEQAPGRSYRKIETQTSERCPGADVVVIHSDWPHEAYGAYCEGEAMAFVECEWGECRER